MALFAKFDIPPTAKAAKDEKFKPTVIQPSQVSRLSQAEPIEILPIQKGHGIWNLVDIVSGRNGTSTNNKPCYCCKGTDYWLGGTEKYPHWVCRKCHPPAPGAERLHDKT